MQAKLFISPQGVHGDCPGREFCQQNARIVSTESTANKVNSGGKESSGSLGSLADSPFVDFVASVVAKLGFCPLAEPQSIPDNSEDFPKADRFGQRSKDFDALGGSDKLFIERGGKKNARDRNPQFPQSLHSF